jgi:hypothetical protein
MPEAAVDRGSFAREPWRMVAEVVTYCQLVYAFTECLFEWEGQIRIGVGEVESFEGVGRGVMGLIRLWKYGEKSKGPTGAGVDARPK